MNATIAVQEIVDSYKVRLDIARILGNIHYGAVQACQKYKAKFEGDATISRSEMSRINKCLDAIANSRGNGN